MAEYHLEVNVGPKGKAGPHFHYISATGKYAAKRGVVHIEHGNMPFWAAADPALYWEASDTYERANGSAYRELEVSLPRELPLAMQLDLARKLAAEVCGTLHAFSLAIHHTKASDGGWNPHLHFEFSERIQDGIERGMTTFFRRANKSAPEKGGCVKDASWQAITHGRQKYGAKACSRLLDIREKWAAMCNSALEAFGSYARVDHRSHAARGIYLLPQPKVGAKSWHLHKRAGIKNERFKAYEDVVDCNNAIIKESPNAALAGAKQRLIDAEQELSVLEAVPEPNRSSILRKLVENEKRVRRLDREIHSLEYGGRKDTYDALMEVRRKRDAGSNWLMRAFNSLYYRSSHLRLMKAHKAVTVELASKVMERKQLIKRFYQHPDAIRLATEQYDKLAAQHRAYIDRKDWLEQEIESAKRDIDASQLALPQSDVRFSHESASR